MTVVTGIACSNCGASLPKRRRPCRKCGDTRRTIAAEINATVTATATMSAATKRGPESWAYFNMIAGILLTIVLGVIAVLDGIPGWYRALMMVVVASVILVALADNGAVHNLLLRLKRFYEDKWR